MHFGKKVNKKVGKDIVTPGDEISLHERLDTGSLSLNVELGGGIPRFKITTISGPWSSGKSSLVTMIAAMFQRNFPEEEILWVDAEGAFEPVFAKSFGMDPSKINLARPEYAQQAYDIVLSAVAEKVGLIIIDSIAALAPKEELEKDMEGHTMAVMARLNSKLMRKLQADLSAPDNRTTVVAINQLRQNVTGYGPPMVEPGGEALNYYPAVKIQLKTGEYFDGKKVYKSITANDEGVEVKAQVIKFYVEKNKTAPPKRRGHFWFYFDTLDAIRRKGTFDRLEEVVRYTKKYDIVRQRGSIYDLINPDTGELRSFKGTAQLVEYIRSDPQTQQWVEAAVMAKVAKEMAGEIIEPEPQVVGLHSVEGDDEAEGDESSEGGWSVESAG